ncbi:amidohydrolase [Methylobacterium currus]|uniref:Amidohydrolase n=1 Tax=Methylobacterium currus TaxID=2051553 RepID=A0A2R4WPI4_9HYPH|nr:amidohydrolase [Methylobacterium currus]AWB23415.1 amidohydrolase [Methylobacterium currus]
MLRIGLRAARGFRAEDVPAGAVGPARRTFLKGACACAGLAFLPRNAAAEIGDAPVPAPARPVHDVLDAAAREVEAAMIAWRRDIHANPELGNQEHRTAALVARHLRGLGYEVREGVAHTGIVALLKGGGGPGPVVALRADMDALPVTEEVDLPFASKVRTEWGGQQVGVMHACGHDCHVAILMAAAQVLAAHRARLPGTVKLLFQPAEEGVPRDGVSGAQLMVEEGALRDPKPDMVLALHVMSALPVGSIGYRPGPTLAASDRFTLRVTGRQTHGAMPWNGVDPIVIGAAIVTALQTVVSRETDIVRSPAVLTVGVFRGGVRNNIIPQQAEMEGTLRTFDEAQRQRIRRRVGEIAESIAAGMNGKAEVTWGKHGYPSVRNDAGLTARSAQTLARLVGDRAVRVDPVMASEDFSYFSREVPGFYYLVGITPPGTDPANAAPNHSPRFTVDEAGLMTGLRATLHLVADVTGMA